MRPFLGLSLLAALTGACSADRVTRVDENTDPVPLFAELNAERSAEEVARAIALAMSDVEIRHEVRDAMRASRMVEHKLVLQEFVVTSGGQKVLAAAASALNVASGELGSLVASLPVLDFYVPFEKHRLSWRGTADVQVAATFDPASPILAAHSTSGRVDTLRFDDGVPLTALMILHPAELKGKRDAPQPATPGVVIQDADDGDTWSLSLQPGQQLMKAQNGMASAFGSTSPGAPQAGMISGVYINHFNVQLGDGWFGNLEMEFRSVAAVPPIYAWIGTYNQTPIFESACELGAYVRGGISEDDGYDGLFPLSPGVTNISLPFPYSCNGHSNAVYSVRIVEDDGIITGDGDEFGWRFYEFGAYPNAASLNTVDSFFENTWGPSRSSYLRLQYN